MPCSRNEGSVGVPSMPLPAYIIPGTTNNWRISRYDLPFDRVPSITSVPSGVALHRQFHSYESLTSRGVYPVRRPKQGGPCHVRWRSDIALRFSVEVHAYPMSRGTLRWATPRRFVPLHLGQMQNHLL